MVLVSGPYKGDTGVVVGTRGKEKHYVIRFRHSIKKGSKLKVPFERILGLWWLEAAANGASVPALPLVNVSGDPKHPLPSVLSIEKEEEEEVVEEEDDDDEAMDVVGGGGRSSAADGDDATKEDAALGANVGGGGGFSIEPLSSCPHLIEGKTIPSASAMDTVVKNALRNTCQVCKIESENWVCLADGFVACGRYKGGHALAHSNRTGGVLSVSLEDLSVWCNECENYLDTFHIAELREIFTRLHVAKFGVEPVFPKRPTLDLATHVRTRGKCGEASEGGPPPPSWG